MTKEQMLDLLKLLSALESWSFCNDKPLPDYLHEDLLSAVVVLKEGVLK